MEYTTDEDHLQNLGQMIEQMENFVRSNLDMLYMSKNQETVDSIRILHPSDLPKRSLLAELSNRRNLQWNEYLCVLFVSRIVFLDTSV